VSKLYRHLSWYIGHTAYNLLKIKDREEPKKEKEDKDSKDRAKKAKEQAHKEVI
jgi:hypothetical protein